MKFLHCGLDEIELNNSNNDLFDVIEDATLNISKNTSESFIQKSSNKNVNKIEEQFY